MRIPELISASIDWGETDLGGLIVELTVSADRKNPYSFFEDHKSGFATLTRDDSIGHFKDHWESGLMDHDGGPERAAPVVFVSLYDPTWSLNNPESALAWPLLKYQRAKWSSRQDEYRYRTTSRNLEFVASPITVDLEKK